VSSNLPGGDTGVFQITYTGVKTKTSAPPPLHPTTCAVLTRRAAWRLSPHRTGTRSRRCGRRLTGVLTGLLTVGRTEDVGTAWATPAEQAVTPPRARPCLAQGCRNPSVSRLTASCYRYRTSGGWRSQALWACLCQLLMRSVASKLVSGVRTRPSAFFQESSSKGGVEFCRACASGELPRWASPLLTVHRLV
jgi:hypothetical protein